MRRAILQTVLNGANIKKMIQLRHGGGTFNFGIANGKNVLWKFPNGTTSRVAQPNVTLQAGVTKVFCDNWGESGLQLTDGSTDANFTGSLADLQGKLTYYLRLTNCTLVTGSLADLQGKLTYYLDLTGCTLITGVYTPVGSGTPTTTILTATGLSSEDMDNTLIAYAAATKNNGTFTATGKTRTAASDDAIATLTGRGWTISGITKV